MRAAFRQTQFMTVGLRHGLRVLAAIGLAIAWGLASGALRAPFFVVIVGGLAAAALAFWLERDVLADPATAARKDFRLIAAAGFGFLAVIGVGVTSLGYLAAIWLAL